MQNTCMRFSYTACYFIWYLKFKPVVILATTFSFGGNSIWLHAAAIMESCRKRWKSVGSTSVSMSFLWKLLVCSPPPITEQEAGSFHLYSSGIPLKYYHQVRVLELQVWNWRRLYCKVTFLSAHFNLRRWICSSPSRNRVPSIAGDIVSMTGFSWSSLTVITVQGRRVSFSEQLVLGSLRMSRAGNPHYSSVNISSVWFLHPCNSG